jgi:hypothetical protein
MTNLKIKDLFKIDYFNYWLLSEICDYLFDNISNKKCYLTNWVSSCNLIDNENFEKIYMSILEKKGMYLYPITPMISYRIPLDNCLHPYLYRDHFTWNLPIVNSRILDNSQRREIQNLGMRTIISDMSWSKGVHKHFINISGAINTLYLGIVNHNEDLKTRLVHSDENLIVPRICNKFNGDVNLELTIDCDLGKLYAKENNYEVLISNFTPNKRVHLGAYIGNWRIKAVVKKSYYFC